MRHNGHLVQRRLSFVHSSFRISSRIESRPTTAQNLSCHRPNRKFPTTLEVRRHVHRHCLTCSRRKSGGGGIGERALNEFLTAYRRYLRTQSPGLRLGWGRRWPDDILLPPYPKNLYYPQVGKCSYISLPLSPTVGNAEKALEFIFEPPQ